jgi:TonB family protein
VRSRLSRLACLPPLAAALAATPAVAQSSLPTRAPGQRCSTLPDSVRGPTPGQLAEVAELRDRLVAIGRRNGVTQPQGLLLVDVDSTRQGQVLFIESNYPDAGVRQVTESIGVYLQSLQAGRGYQALFRVDGDYPALAPGKQHCLPVLYTGNDERVAMIDDVERRHPDAGRLAAPVQRQVSVLMVVTRTGTVAFAAVSRSSGDAFLDAEAVAMSRRFRFAPATLDGQPFDMRIRLPVRFELQ